MRSAFPPSVPMKTWYCTELVTTGWWARKTRSRLLGRARRAPAELVVAVVHLLEPSPARERAIPSNAP